MRDGPVVCHNGTFTFFVNWDNFVNFSLQLWDSTSLNTHTEEIS